MHKTLKVLSALLTYPTAALVDAVPELAEALESEGLVPPAARRALDVLLEELVTHDLYDLQECYVLLFDRTRALSLHLFEHVHGESRDRGQAMVDLKAVYERAGLQPATSELPDYLPLFLEFLATRPMAEALDLLAEPAHIIAALAERLAKRGSSYQGVFQALVALAKADPRSPEVARLLATPDPDAADLEALDAGWEEEEVTFGPAALACGKDGLIAKLRAGRRPAPGIEPLTAQRPVVTTTRHNRV